MNSVEIMESVVEELKQVMDPEIPVNIVDLGMVQGVRMDEKDALVISLRVSFLGCPAKQVIENEVRQVLTEKFNTIPTINVVWDFDDSWNILHISADGVDALMRHGVAVPVHMNSNQWVIHCPYCQSSKTMVDTEFGSSLCRSIYLCNHCKNPFEAIKKIPQKSKDLTEKIYSIK